MLGTQLCLPKIHVEALTSNLTVFGDTVFKEVIKNKRDHNPIGPMSLEEEEETPGMCVKRKSLVRTP